MNGYWIATQGGAARLGPEGSIELLAALADPNAHALTRTSTGLSVGTEGGTSVLPAAAR